MSTDTFQQRGGLWASGASVISAIAASACCWLPLLLLAFGVTATGVAATFERFRPLFLGGAAILLATGFYLNYFRKERCAPGSACARTNPKLKRFSRIMLWIATVVVLAFALFPEYVGYLLGGRAPMSTIQTGGEVEILGIKGMTCEGCAANIEKTLSRIDGVRNAVVNFDDARAVVTLDPSSPPSSEQLIGAIEKLGYKGEVLPNQPRRDPTAP